MLKLLFIKCWDPIADVADSVALDMAEELDFP